MSLFNRQSEKNAKHFFQTAFYTPRGFSLVEILIVLAILAFAMVMAIFSFDSFFKQQAYIAEVNEMHRNIVEQRTRAISSLSNSDYGVMIASSSLVLFTGSNYVPADSSNESIALLQSQATSSLSYGGVATTSVSFAKRTGVPSATGTIDLYPVSADSSTTTIIIYASGLIE